ncbi:hypothetical protein [Helicobacter bizzozeronii]|uniref:hypothetical protein n=1 Tax=Helicobacter bizzozeronii TaxID=56877 RepID=UPI000CEF2BD0|nr:hypothetical protein [Helicobacter bizzozeronii]
MNDEAAVWYLHTAWFLTHSSSFRHVHTIRSPTWKAISRGGAVTPPWAWGALVGGGGGGGRSPPPNAIAYGSGYIPMKGMIKAGFWLNVMGIGLISLFAYTAITHIFVR